MKIRLLALAALLCAAAYAAGNIGQSLQKLGETGNYALTFYLDGDQNNGTMPVTLAQLPPAQGNRILQVEVVPGVPAPTSGFKVQILDSFGADIMTGLMNSVDTTAPQFFSATSATPPLFGAFSISVSGNSVANAKAKVVVFFGPTTLVNATAGAPGPAGPVGPQGPIGSAGGGLPAANYIFTPQSPGGSLIIGNNTVNLTPVPAGVNGTDAGHYLYVSAGVGTAEACLITGGSGVAGANTGQVVINCAHTHSGAWTIQTATAGVQEAIQTAQTAGGGIVDASAPAPLQVNGNITFSGAHITLRLSGQGVALNNASIFFSAGGSDNALIGTGNTPVTATATTTDAIALNGCHWCAVSGLFIDRTATPAAVGANGIHIYGVTASDNLKVNNISSRHHYHGVYAESAPVVSAWSGIEVEHSVSSGIQFDADNDEHLVNIVSDYNGGAGIQLGKGAGTSGCIGGFRLTNAVTFANGGDGLHVEGAAGAACVFVFVSNIHADTDTGYELYLKNAGALNISGSEFVNGQGGWIGDGVNGVFLSALRFQGASKDGLYITNGASTINGASVTLSDSSLGSGATYAGLHIDGAAANVNIAGLAIAQANTTSAYGVQIGTSSGVHLIGTQLVASGNMTTPVSVAAGLTDVFVDAAGGFISLTPANGWSVVTATAARLEANGNTVRVKGMIQAGTLTDATTVFTLPAGLRPNVPRALPVTMVAGGGTPMGTASIMVNTDGTCNIYGAAGAAFLRLDAVTFSIN